VSALFYPQTGVSALFYPQTGVSALFYPQTGVPAQSAHAGTPLHRSPRQR